MVRGRGRPRVDRRRPARSRGRAGSLIALGLGVSDAHSAFVAFDPGNHPAVAVQINLTNGGPQAVIALEALAASAAATAQP